MKITPINGKSETLGSPFIYRGNTLIVARSSNSEFKKEFRDAMKPYQDEFDNNRMSEEQSNKLMISCVAKSILVGWESIKDNEGKDWPYSEENAVSLLTDDKDCYDAVIKFSDNIENYLVSSQEKLKVK